MVPTAAPVSAEVVLPLGGEMTYLADAARFTDCMTGRSFPIAMEGEYLQLERAYVASARTPGAPLYVTFDGAILHRPRMEGEGVELTVVVKRFINAWPNERCERARAQASLANTYWRTVRLGGEPVSAADGRREPHLVLRDVDGRTSYSATVGCNQFVGGYSLEKDTIRFSPGAVTLMPCPAPLDERERALTQALAHARTWRITANTLELFDADGGSLALFEAVYF